MNDHHEDAAAAGKSPAAAVAALLRRGFDAWMRGVQISITHRALARLDDRTLADIGLHRSSLRWSAQQVVDAARTRRTQQAALSGLAGRVDFGGSMPTAAANDAAPQERVAA